MQQIACSSHSSLACNHLHIHTMYVAILYIRKLYMQNKTTNGISHLYRIGWMSLS